MDVVDKLKLLGSLKTGDQLPKELGADEYDWGQAIGKLARDAAKEIEDLRARIDLMCSDV